MSSKIQKFRGLGSVRPTAPGLRKRFNIYADDVPSESPFRQAQPYPTQREDIRLLGLGEAAPYGVSAEADRGPVDPRTCTSKKLPFEYLRFDTCVTPMKGAKELPALKGSRDAVEVIRGAVHSTNRGREFFMVLCLNARNAPIGITVPHIGGRAFAMVEPSVVLQAVVLSGAMSFICAHNHPSGDPMPSPEDIEITKQLVAGGKLIKVELIDHIVMVDDGRYTSFLDRGLMPR
jgi:DNA repair protein RadC